MADETKEEVQFTTYVIGSLAITIVLLLLLPMLFVMGKSTAYSAYEDEELYQLSDMRDSLADPDGDGEDSDDGYFIANTMSTPMLVNDWKDPHRTMLLIIAPEKPIDETEADAIYDFVTEKGGKVIVAADGTNANRLATKFGVTYFGYPLNDENQHWLEYDDDGPLYPSWQNVWSVAAVQEDVDEMGAGASRKGCAEFQIVNENPVSCRIPVMFRAPTGMKFEPSLKDTEDPGHRDVKVLARASSSAFIDLMGDGDASNALNPAPGDLTLMIRFDYPNIVAYDRVRTGQGGLVGGDIGELHVTGSIVFVSDEEAFSNRLWTLPQAVATGLSPSCEGVIGSCWMQEIHDNNEWQGNEVYYDLLIHSMMEFDNLELSGEIRNDEGEFQVVFDESRHITGVISAPFVETMGTVVLLTSNTFLKWLVVLNVGLLLLVAMMVVPEKENWRHVFDLTKFNQRPNKLDPSTYRLRVQQSLFTKIRVYHDLTRDQMAAKPPSEIQSMIGDPRLVELAYSQSRTYSPKELRQLMQAIRRWGKNS